MCGIVGYIGNKKAKPILINGLLRLEYRGYDSAGISVIENNSIKTFKNRGRIKNLMEVPGINNLEGVIGIGHTRWATHGKPSSINSHPHLDNENKISVVHNGIIENYNEIKELLLKEGYHFVSQTDTEVIPNLIDFNLKKDNSNDDLKILRAVQKTCNMLKGSFAIEVISSLLPNNIIVVRKDSPLVIGKGENENYISSDIPAILSFTKDFYLLNDLEYAVLFENKIDFYNSDLKPITKEIKNITWDATSAEKDGYDDFMLKEIYEQPKSIRETIGARIQEDSNSQLDDIPITKEYLSSINKIFLVACGTAMHAGLATKPIFEKLCNVITEVDVASEFRYREPLLDEKTLCIFISQSGETADTIAALKLAKSKGSKTIAISNVIGSSITREADYSLYTHAGPEIAVASTKAYTSQITLLAIIAIYFAEQLEISKTEVSLLKNELSSLPQKLELILKDTEKIKNFAKKVYKEKDLFFLGRGTDYAVALEGSLKLKEISYIHSEAYSAGELKHGPIALIENDVTVISIITNPITAPKMVSNIQEVITRGAKTLVITNQKLEYNEFNEIITIPQTHPLLSPILSVIPMQLFAYYISKEKGLDVDKPRNLAKSVTVE